MLASLSHKNNFKRFVHGSLIIKPHQSILLLIVVQGISRAFVSLVLKIDKTLIAEFLGENIGGDSVIQVRGYGSSE